MICRRCHHKGHVRLLPLPLTGELVPLCPRCIGPAFIGHMHTLVVHHG